LLAVKLVCCCCGVPMGDVGDHPDGGVSHGMCPACTAAMLFRVAEYRPLRERQRAQPVQAAPAPASRRG